MKDMYQQDFKVGQDVVRACSMGSHKSPYLKMCKVTRVEDGKLYLDDSNVAIVYPERLLILQLVGKE